jgi:MFS family permease
MTTANGTVQLGTAPAVRGRVMAIYMAIFMGGTPIGAPFVGWVANQFGPRWGLGVAGASGVLALLVGAFWLIKYRGLRLHFDARRFSISHNGYRDPVEVARESFANDQVAADKS